VKSERKQLKENSIDKKHIQRFTENITYLKEGLSAAHRIKKITVVHETVIRIKDKVSKVAKFYKITYQEDKKKVL